MKRVIFLLLFVSVGISILLAGSFPESKIKTKKESKSNLYLGLGYSADLSMFACRGFMLQTGFQLGIATWEMIDVCINYYTNPLAHARRDYGTLNFRSSCIGFGFANIFKLDLHPKWNFKFLTGLEWNFYSETEETKYPMWTDSSTSTMSYDDLALWGGCEIEHLFTPKSGVKFRGNIHWEPLGTYWLTFTGGYLIRF